MATSLTQWAALHTVDSWALWQRWKNSPDLEPKDDLKGDDRFNVDTRVWTVKTELEMIRLIGALQWQNPSMKLWFRGETAFNETAFPKRYRVDKPEKTEQGIRWLNEHAGKDRALRDRSPLARAAILQHYGCPTSLVDVSASYEVAAAFAFEPPKDRSGSGDAHIRLYALPRHQRAVTVFDDADVVLVDLHAELPSYCARPHVQQAGFVARRAAVHSDIKEGRLISPSRAGIDPLCVAHLRLDFKDFDGVQRFYQPRKDAGVRIPMKMNGDSD